MDIKKDVQASDLINLITEKIEFLKSIGIKTPNILEEKDKIFQVSEAKKHLVEELEILKASTIEGNSKEINSEVYMMTMSIIKQIETLAAIESLQNNNKFNEVDIMIGEYIKNIKNEGEILYKINLMCLDKNEKKYEFVEKLHNICARQSDILIKVITYNSENKDKEADDELNKLIKLYEEENEVFKMIDDEFNKD